MINTMANNKLTAKQDIFVKEIAKGNTQRQACIVAYPNAKNWTQKAIDVRASQLMSNQAIQEKLRRINNKENKKVLWNRKKATKTILDIIETNKKEQIAIQEIQYKLINTKEEEIEELINVLKNEEDISKKIQIIKELKRIEHELYKLKIECIVNEKNSNAILNGIKILNKMYGLRNLDN